MNLQNGINMKQLKKAGLVMAFLALTSVTVHAQYVTTHAKASMPSQQNGIYYSLPRTVLQLDFIIEETQSFEGPYSNYVSYIGAESYVLEDNKEYKIKEVQLHVLAEADPNATFFVAMSSKKDDKPNFCLTPQGILRGVGIDCPLEPQEKAHTSLLESPSYPDEVTFKYQYGAGNNRGEEQMARSAADMISKIRDEKLKLVTGFQETAFSLDTYRQMYSDLEVMENDYLSLFIGKQLTRTFIKTIYVIPNKEVPNQTVAKFSTDDGLTAGTAGPGTAITVQTQSMQTTANFNAPSQSAVESLNLENKLFYRIPEIANIKVNMGGNALLECRETIAQYGVFMLAPLGKTKLALDPQTGQIISLGME